MASKNKNGITNRGEARQYAVMAMHSAEATGYSIRDVLERVELMETMPGEFPEFARTLCYLVEDHQKQLKKEISAALQKWKWERLGIAERGILLLAAAEIFYMADIPPRVTINEYVNLAKKYAGENSPKFVNGVLDRLAKLSNKPDVQMNRAGT